MRETTPRSGGRAGPSDVESASRVEETEIATTAQIDDGGGLRSPLLGSGV